MHAIRIEAVSLNSFFPEFFRKNDQFGIFFLEPYRVCGIGIGDERYERYGVIKAIDSLSGDIDKDFMKANDLGYPVVAEKPFEMAYAMDGNKIIPEFSVEGMLGDAVKKDVTGFEIIRGYSIAILKKHAAKVHLFAETVKQKGLAFFRPCITYAIRQSFCGRDMPATGIKV
jgi:hypothetical protein